MCVLTMNMSSFEVERNDSSDYENEIVSTGWNPALALQPSLQSNKGIPADLVAVDAESFLSRMYAYQR